MISGGEISLSVDEERLGTEIRVFYVNVQWQRILL